MVIWGKVLTSSGVLATFRFTILLGLGTAFPECPAPISTRPEEPAVHLTAPSRLLSRYRRLLRTDRGTPFTSQSLNILLHTLPIRVATPITFSPQRRPRHPEVLPPATGTVTSSRSQTAPILTLWARLLCQLSGPLRVTPTLRTLLLREQTLVT